MPVSGREAPARGCLSWGCLPWGCVPRGCTPPVMRITHRCKIITFPQLRLRTVINLNRSDWPFKANGLLRKYSTWRIQDFPEEGAPTWGGGAKLLFGLIFAQNYMRMKQMDRVKYHKHIDINYIEPNSSCDLRVGTFTSHVILYTLNPVH